MNNTNTDILAHLLKGETQEAIDLITGEILMGNCDFNRWVKHPEYLIGYADKVEVVDGVCRISGEVRYRGEEPEKVQVEFGLG